MSEKYSTVTVGGATYEYREIPKLTCEEIWRMYRDHPDWTIEHERCDDEACTVCQWVFGVRNERSRR